jgi:hypothetical protein
MRAAKPTLGTVAVALALLAVPAAATGAERLPAGATIAGVDVGGLGPVGAERELRRVLGATWEREITVRAGRREVSLSPTRAGFVIEYDAMLKRAFYLAERRRSVNVPLDRSIDSDELTAAAKAVARRFRRAPRNARVRFGITRAVRIRHRFGRGIDPGDLRRDLLAELRQPSEERLIVARRVRIRPSVTLRELSRVYGTYVSIDRRTFTLRLFKRLRVVRRYGVAVGMAGYETPRGVRRVLYKDRNPAWHAPNRPWAGALAGQTIPPGDPRNPLKAWFIALGGGVGIHGTSEEWTIGTRASHGCIRMRVRDVIRLAPSVPVGTPVLIR